jgi:hypothetical protein
LVVAEDKVLVADVDAHTVYALDARDGRRLWEYTTGARVDSPPTLHGGMAIFDFADGHVYCLRASDGVLVWRFEAAPQQRLVSAFGQLESPWPVPGSALVHEGKCWFAAGRSSYLDGGIHLYALDPATGRVEFEQTIHSMDSETGKMPLEVSPNEMAGVLNDILATDGSGVCLRRTMIVPLDGKAIPRVYTTGGYLDPSWFNRTFWVSGPAQSTGLMVLGKDVAYGVEVYNERNRDILAKPGVQAYRLKCFALNAEAQGQTDKFGGSKPLWEQSLFIRVTAMVRAGDTIFVAGPPDVLDPQDPHGAWEGRKGGVLAAFAASDGTKLAEHSLQAPPVWDGMAAARGCIYLAHTDGTITSFASQNQKRP